MRPLAAFVLLNLGLLVSGSSVGGGYQVDPGFEPTFGESSSVAGLQSLAPERCQRPVAPRDSAMVTQLAVAGFMVSAAGKTLLIDALHRHPQHAPGPETLEKLENALPPFDNVDLILVSHSHTDHFHPESVAEHLIQNPEAVLVSGRLVRDELAELPSFEHFHDRVIVVSPEPGEVVEIEANGIAMKIFRLSHGERNQDYSADNLGMVADMGGTKIFNTGDIMPYGQTEIFQRARMDRDGIDIAFLAFHMFDADFPEAATIIDSYIQPRYIVPSHLDERHFGEFTDRIEERYPNAIIFSSKGETRFIY